MPLYGINRISIAPESITDISGTPTDAVTKYNYSTPIDSTPLNSGYSGFTKDVNTGKSGVSEANISVLASLKNY